MKYLYLVFIFLILACDDDTSSIMSSGSNGDGDPIDTPVSSYFYKHDKEIKNFIVDFNTIAIVDNEGLSIIVNGEQVGFYESVTYVLQGQTFTANLNSVNDIISTCEGVFIGTTDGHFIRYRDGEFIGYPISVYKMKRFMRNTQILALWEIALGDDGIDGVILSDIELRNEDDFRIRDNWPCLDLDFEVNHCEEAGYSDFSSLDRYTAIGQNGSLLTTLDRSTNNSFIVDYKPNFNDLPFDRFKHVEIFRQANEIAIVPDKFYFDHLWTSTNNGLAYIIMQDDEPVDFVTNEWIHLNKGNSNISSNSIDDMRYISDERLIAISNSPPSVNYINAEDGNICSFNTPKNTNISSIYVDVFDLYISQGDEIFEIKDSDFYTTCGF